MPNVCAIRHVNQPNKIQISIIYPILAVRFTFISHILFKRTKEISFMENENSNQYTDETLVYSRPSKDWSYKAISKYYAFECPNTSLYKVHDSVEWITFRKPGGEMSKIYKIEKRLHMNLQKGYIDYQLDPETPQDELFRVRGFIKKMRENTKASQAFLLEEKQVFLLSKDTIFLSHKPKSKKKGNAYKCYYKMGDLINNNELEPVKIKA